MGTASLLKPIIVFDVLIVAMILIDTLEILIYVNIMKDNLYIMYNIMISSPTQYSVISTALLKYD